eukprot:m.121901 g.121901  ORF g.121901 m.121901 type:complete len:582 (-) comp12931_c1_seq4:1080-2825(-)
MTTQKRITQDTFNEVVKENIDEFEMDAEEAVEDAWKQFQTQGVDLSNIVKALALEGTEAGDAMMPPVVLTVNRLAEFATTSSSDISEGVDFQEIHKTVLKLRDQLNEGEFAHLDGNNDDDVDVNDDDITPTPSGRATPTQLAMNGEENHHNKIKLDEEVETELAKTTTSSTTTSSSAATTETTTAATAPPSISEARALAAAKGAFPALLFASELFSKHCEKEDTVDNREMLADALETLALLLDGQPDLVSPPNPDSVLAEVKDNPHVTQLCKHLQDFKNDGSIMHFGIAAVRHACTKHETNRQTFVADGIVELLLHCIEHHTAHPKAVSEAALCLRTLTKDDDIRVAFGKGHDHAKLMVTEHNALGRIMKCLATFTEDAATTAELCKTLARLSVRNEYCQEIVDLGGLQLILPALTAHSNNEEVAASSMHVLGVIAGNDNVKDKIREVGGIATILETMEKQQKIKSVIDKGCGALASLCLRQKDNAQNVIALNGATVLVKALIMFPNSSSVQKNACRAIRNIAARNPTLREPILHEGAEHYLNVAMKRKVCHDDAKAALRDLGCEVKLVEMWTGKKGALKK